MSPIEERLRDAYQEAAATVPPASLRGVPALEPAGGPARRRPLASRHQPARRRRLLAPVAAATAVTAIVVAAVAVPQLLPRHGGVTGAGPARPARFFIATGRAGDLMVYSAVTGRRTADIRPVSPHTALSFAAATGNDRVFIVASNSTATCVKRISSRLLRLTLTAAGKADSISSLPVPKLDGSVTALASAADGRTIAYTSTVCILVPDPEIDPGQLGVVHTDGAPSQHWSWDPMPGQSVGSLSVTADGKMIEFAVAPNKSTGPDSGEVLPVREIRLLPTDAPPGFLNQRSRVAVTVRTAAPGSAFTSALIAASGRAVYFCTERGQFSRHPAETLRAYDVASGTVSVLHSFGSSNGQGCLLGSSAGELLIVRDITRTPSRVDRLNLRTGRLTPVPVRRSVDEGNSSVPW